MSIKEDRDSEFDFITALTQNQYKTPNLFTVRMGQIIKQTREEQGLSQTELAEKMHRRPATISAIENGKSEIGILTLVHFAIIFQKRISYFFPPMLLRNMLVDVKTDSEKEILDTVETIGHFGDITLTRAILGFLADYYVEEYDAMMSGRTSKYSDDD